MESTQQCDRKTTKSIGDMESKKAMKVEKKRFRKKMKKVVDKDKKM